MSGFRGCVVDISVVLNNLQSGVIHILSIYSFDGPCLQEREVSLMRDES